MKRLLTILSLVAISTVNGLAQKDPKALQILDAMSGKYQATPDFKADFSYMMENPDENINEGFEGIIYVKGAAYKIEMEEQEIRFDGEYVWTYAKEFEEVTVSADEEEGISIAGIFDIYKEGYKYLYLESADNGKTDVVDLVPEDLDLSYYKIRMRIDSGDRSLKSFKIFDKSGSRYVYTVKTFTPDKSLKASDFSWTDQSLKGKELIDFR